MWNSNVGNLSLACGGQDTWSRSRRHFSLSISVVSTSSFYVQLATKTFARSCSGRQLWVWVQPVRQHRTVGTWKTVEDLARSRWGGGRRAWRALSVLAPKLDWLLRSETAARGWSVEWDQRNSDGTRHYCCRLLLYVDEGGRKHEKKHVGIRADESRARTYPGGENTNSVRRKRWRWHNRGVLSLAKLRLRRQTGLST